MTNTTDQRLREIQERVAADAGFTVTQEELDADIAAAKAEYRATHPRILHPSTRWPVLTDTVIDGDRDEIGVQE
jgi:hypothetical protein